MFDALTEPTIAQTRPTNTEVQERDFRMSKNCEVLWGTQYQFDFGVEKDDNGKYFMYIRRTYIGNGGELLLLSGVHENE